jgi:ribosomal protein L29
MEDKNTKKKNKLSNYAEMSVKDLKFELQKVLLNVRTGKESNTSLISKIKREIARKLTNSNK